MINALKSYVLLVVILVYPLVSNAQKVEAENGSLSGTEVASSHDGFSGSGYVTGFDADGDAVTISVTAADDGLHDLWVGYSAPYGDKTNDIYINDQFAGSQFFPSTSIFTEGLFGKVYLEKGTNEIKIVKNWGWFEVDYIRIAPSAPNDIHNYPETLSNQYSIFEANELYRFIRDYYGHRIISGQQTDYSGRSDEFEYIESKTGKGPALRGFDLIDYSPSRIAYGVTPSQQTNLALDWWDRGGIVNVMWHWNAPSDLLNTDDQPWWRGFYSDATTFDLDKAMNDEASTEYELILRDIDAIAVQLQELEDAGVPVLWRPLHEAEGGWFWWGNHGADACKWLWQVLYHRLTTVHELDNLIWVWTGTNSEYALDWYPGDAYVDIVGADIYLDNKNYLSNFSMFDGMVGLHEGKRVVTLSETGTIPDPDALKSEKAYWSWFCVWSGDFIMDGVRNEVSHVNKVYNHEYVVTYDELPNFYNYESPDFPDEEESPNGLAELESVQINTYPNPVINFLEIEITEEEINLQVVKLYDSQGRLVRTEPTSGRATRLDLSMLIAGVYVLEVDSDRGQYSTKIMKR